MKIHDSKYLSEIYRLLPVIGILLLALLGLWWGNRRESGENIHSADLRTYLCHPIPATRRLSETADI